MRESDWTIDPIPTQARDVLVSVRSPRLLLVLLNRICWTEARAVEALAIASSYFSRYPKVVLNCIRHAADEARHTSLFAERIVDLGGRLRPFPGRSDMLSLMPGFKNGSPGDLDALADFMSRGYVEEYRSLLIFEELARALEQHDSVTEQLVRRVIKDERAHVAAIREILEWLIKNEYGEIIAAGLGKHRESAMISV